MAELDPWEIPNPPMRPSLAAVESDPWETQAATPQVAAAPSVASDPWEAPESPTGLWTEFTSGFELAQDIQAKYPRIPVIMLTGVSEHMKGDWEYKVEGDGSWLPVHKFLKKPVDFKVLIKEIEALLALAEKGLPAPPKPATAAKATR